MVYTKRFAECTDACRKGGSDIPVCVHECENGYEAWDYLPTGDRLHDVNQETRDGELPVPRLHLETDGRSASCVLALGLSAL